MKRKFLDGAITILAVVGFFVFIGAVGTMDFMVEQRINYPISNTIRTAVPGLLLMLPAIIREVI